MPQPSIEYLEDYTVPHKKSYYYRRTPWWQRAVYIKGDKKYPFHLYWYGNPGWLTGSETTPYVNRHACFGPPDDMTFNSGNMRYANRVAQRSMRLDEQTFRLIQRKQLVVNIIEVDLELIDMLVNEFEEKIMAHTHCQGPITFIQPPGQISPYDDN